MLTLVVLNAGAMVVALLGAVALGVCGRTSQLLLGTLCGYLVIVHSLVLLAGLLGCLTGEGLMILLTGAMAGALWIARGAKHDHANGFDGMRFTAAALFAPLAAITSAVVWTWPHAFHATQLWVWDDYTYHMVYPALWLHQHAIAAAIPSQSFTMQAWYPLSASLVAAWFMVPFQASRGEALAWVSLTGPLYAGITAGGAAELLARLGCRRGAWAVPVVLLATSHRIAVMASSFSDADLAQAAALFGALVFAVPRGDVESGGEVRVDAGYAGLLTGIALGVKVSAVPLALIIAVMMALRAGEPSASRLAILRGAIPIGLVFAGSWVATGGYWYARNIIHTGNPLYPAAFLIWPGASFPETTLVEYTRHYGLRRAVADALLVYANWPAFHATLAVIGLVGLAGWLAFRRRSLTRSRRYFAYGTLAIAGAIVILLPAAPYSAGNAMTFRAGFIHWDSMRYIALLPILGWVALGFLVEAAARHWRALLATLVTTAALLASGIALLASPVVLVALALGARLLQWRAQQWPTKRPSGTRGALRFSVTRLAGGRLCTEAWRANAVRRELLVASTLVLVVAAIVVWAHGAKSAATTAAVYREPLFGAAVAVLDRQAAGTRVAVFGDQWVYPAFGARNHLQPVRLDRDGRLATTPIADAMAPGNLTVDPAAFRANLRASRVGLVVLVHLAHPGRSAEWPTQQTALEAIGDARLLHRDGAVAIWQLE
jgi:hypothetical protein